MRAPQPFFELSPSLLRALVLGPLLLVLLATGCATTRDALGGGAPQLTDSQLEELVPARVKDRAGWAKDLADVFAAQRRSRDLSTVCSVLAVVEQESGFDPNPAVPDLSKLVRTRLEEQASRLGPLGGPVVRELLSGKVAGDSLTFEQRLARVRTERDLDRVFRDLLRYHEAHHPKTFAALNLASGLLGKGRLYEQNPITTAGSMQVSVRFARELADEEGRDLTDDEVREELYTRRGGLYFGTARLLGYEAGYDAPRFRFADYNAGVFASRNAAVQRMVSELTGRVLVPDGDLLAYDAQGEVVEVRTRSADALSAFRRRFAPDLSEWRLRSDLKHEKERAFEETDTYRAVLETYARVKGHPAPYAQLPEVTLHSPKMRTSRTTSWFAESVEGRYQRCLERGRGFPVASPVAARDLSTLHLR